VFTGSRLSLYYRESPPALFVACLRPLKFLPEGIIQSPASPGFSPRRVPLCEGAKKKIGVVRLPGPNTRWFLALSGFLIELPGFSVLDFWFSEWLLDQNNNSGIRLSTPNTSLSLARTGYINHPRSSRSPHTTNSFPYKPSLPKASMFFSHLTKVLGSMLMSLCISGGLTVHKQVCVPNLTHRDERACLHAWCARRDSLPQTSPPWPHTATGCAHKGFRCSRR